MSKLKPCPWNCGGDIRVSSCIPRTIRGIKVYFVTHRCSILREREIMTKDFNTEQDAIDAWNTRNPEVVNESNNCTTG